MVLLGDQNSLKTLKEWGVNEGIKDVCVCVCVRERETERQREREREGEMVLFKILQIFNLSLCIEG